MDWRVWVFNRLRNSQAIRDDVLESSIYGSGSMTGAPAIKPFLVMRFDPEVIELRDGDRASATSRFLTIFCHDDPGSYDRIDRILGNVHQACEGQVLGSGGIASLWTGDSQDFGDDVFGTIVRNSSFRLVGKVA